MSRILSTVADLMGKFSTNSRESAAKQQDILDNLNISYGQYLDGIASTDSAGFSRVERFQKDPDETFDEWIERAVNAGLFMKISRGAATAVISAINGKNFTVSNKEGVAFAIRPSAPGSAQLIGSYSIELYTGTPDFEYAVLCLSHALILHNTVSDEWFLGSKLWAWTNLSGSAYLDYIRAVSPVEGSLDDAEVLFQLVAYLKHRSLSDDPKDVGAKLFNDYNNLGHSDAELAQMTYQSLFNEYFGINPTHAEVVGWVNAFNTQSGTAYAPLSSFMASIADSLAINNINTFVSSALASSEGSLDRISTYLNSIETDSMSTKEYVDALKGGLNTDQTTYTAKFAQLWSSAKAQSDSNDNTLMVFSDKSTVAPMNFLSGVVAGIVSSGFQLIGLAVTFIFKGIGAIAGAILYTIGTLINAIKSHLVDPSLYISYNEEWNTDSMPWSEWTFDPGNVSLVDYEKYITEHGYFILSTPFCKIYVYKKEDDANRYKIQVCPKPVSKFWIDAVCQYCTTNSIIYKDSHDHYYISSFSKMEMLREYMINHVDTGFDLVPNQTLSNEDQDKSMRHGAAFGLLATRLFILLIQGSGASLYPFNIATGAKEWGGAIGGSGSYTSNPANDLLMFFKLGLSDVIVSASPSWRQILGQDGFTTSQLQGQIFGDIEYGSIPFYKGQYQSGYFYGNPDAFLDYLNGFVPDEYVWTADEPPRSLYHLPRIDAMSAIIGGIALAIAAVAVTVTAVVVSFKIKKAKQKSAALHQAKAESAWTEFSENPTPENYDAYRKSVRSNNLASMYNGGDKLSKVSYWADSTTATDSGSPDPSTPSENVIDGIDEIKRLIR